MSCYNNIFANNWRNEKVAIYLNLAGQIFMNYCSEEINFSKQIIDICSFGRAVTWIVVGAQLVEFWQRVDKRGWTVHTLYRQFFTAAHHWHSSLSIGKRHTILKYRYAIYNIIRIVMKKYLEWLWCEKTRYLIQKVPFNLIS